ncbi:flagellar hook-length control protein FliK [Marinicauda algicola]|uniref:Flagellar hook-length control protein FliK n=2 Tax=Marinicauda algicola TaxID=2029849 RepID=A0A4S2GWL8_9PROT|nr:flagellar hook-length control protein FliK [Marinicauda algicola]
MGIDERFMSLLTTFLAFAGAQPAMDAQRAAKDAPSAGDAFAGLLAGEAAQPVPAASAPGGAEGKGAPVGGMAAPQARGPAGVAPPPVEQGELVEEGVPPAPAPAVESGGEAPAAWGHGAWALSSGEAGQHAGLPSAPAGQPAAAAMPPQPASAGPDPSTLSQSQPAEPGAGSVGAAAAATSGPAALPAGQAGGGDAPLPAAPGLSSPSAGQSQAAPSAEAAGQAPQAAAPAPATAQGVENQAAAPAAGKPSSAAPGKSMAASVGAESRPDAQGAPQPAHPRHTPAQPSEAGQPGARRGETSSAAAEGGQQAARPAPGAAKPSAQPAAPAAADSAPAASLQMAASRQPVSEASPGERVRARIEAVREAKQGEGAEAARPLPDAAPKAAAAAAPRAATPSAPLQGPALQPGEPAPLLPEGMAETSNETADGALEGLRIERAERGAEMARQAQGQAAQPRMLPAQVQTLAARIAQRFSEGGRVFDIRIDPPELGRVEVRLEMGRDNRVNAVLMAEKPEALAELQRSARDLEKSLAEAGLDLGESGLSFELADQGQSHDGAGGEPAYARAFELKLDGAQQDLAASARLVPHEIYGFAIGARGRLDVSV